MDEFERLRALRHWIMETLDVIQDGLVAATGTRAFTAIKSWDRPFPVLSVRVPAAAPNIRAILDHFRQFVVPVDQIPKVWQTLVDLNARSQEGSPKAQAARLVQKAVPGAKFGIDTTFEALVHFAYFATKAYESAGLRNLHEPYRLLMGPPDSTRFGISETTVYAKKNSRRMVGQGTIDKILRKPASGTVRPGWKLSSLHRHIEKVLPDQAGNLADLYGALPMHDTTLRRMILSKFHVQSLESLVGGKPAESFAPTAEELAAIDFLNQISETYV